MQTATEWRRPIGAEPLDTGGVHFRLWAPDCRSVSLVIEGGAGHRAGNRQESYALAAEESGYFSGEVPAAAAGTLYRFQLDQKPELVPDPASRFQPRGPHGPSQVVDPHAFRWNDHGWLGVTRHGQVLYEMHIGTFTPEGTWEAAARELTELAATGVTVLEIMPVAEFPGRFGWGYDGVDLFAPSHLYGTPDDFRRFVDRAHAAGLGVILDVVYNHFGPDGNYLKELSADYFTDRYENEWGEAINFDGDHSGPVREFFIANAGYWIEEFHLDGLRLDATQQIFDGSAEHILAAITRRVRAAGRTRSTFLVAENEPQEVRLVRPLGAGGYGLDALWNDDWHHSAMVALTGQAEAYYTDYLGTPQEFISAAKWGYLYQGQRYAWQKKRRGTPALDIDPSAFVTFLENHDQVANSAQGQRTHQLTSPGRYRAMAALMLLGPATPMLFQGQEFAASSPFLYFADHKPELGRLVREGRRKFLAQFPSIAGPETQAQLIDPADPATFERCKLDPSERRRHAAACALHRDLLELRRSDAVLRARGRVDGAVLAAQSFVLRFFGDEADDRLLIVNFGRDLLRVPAPEPLLAPPDHRRWAVRWSSEETRYGGAGRTEFETADGWKIRGESAAFLVPAPRETTHAG